MRNIGLILLLGLILISCKKDDSADVIQPAMIYKDMNDTAIVFGRYASFDIDGDNYKDFGFFTELVGYPGEQVDRKRWLVNAAFTTNLPTSQDEHLPVLNYGDRISDFPGYNWYNASSVVLAQLKFSNNPPPVWEGPWKNASHRFIPFQLVKPGGLYNGWIEISFSTDEEKLIIHAAAVSKVAGKPVLAGK